MSSDVSAEFQQFYISIEKYVWWLANRSCSDHILMMRDEIASELFLELWKSWARYGERDDINESQLKALTIKILNNRVAELKYRFYVTHRSAEQYVADYDDLSDVLCDELPIFDGRWDRFIVSLSPSEMAVVVAIVTDDSRVSQQIMLKGWRNAVVYLNGGTVTITPRLMSEALHISLKRMRALWRSISRKWSGIYGI